MGSIVYKKDNKDYLAFSSTFGLIIIYDLLSKNQIKSIKLDKSYLINIVKWNKKYLLTIDNNNKRILIICSNNNKIATSIKISQLFSHKRYAKKLIHPLYGESLICIGNDYKTKLFINKNFYKNI